MATLVLSVVGGLVGGRVGAALGAIGGQAIDQRLLAPKGRSGPRLADLAVQTSNYGAQIPRIFGRARVAGSVIWATDLEERRDRVKTGKGRPKQTVYSYAANFAVALSARPIARIGRIWADGNLLRGEAGDFKTPTGFRFYNGSEGQTVDPLIAAAEGSGQAPAYRGISYVVFEDFQLGDYGNRIPSLSFEVIADEADVTLGSVFEELGKGQIIASLSLTVPGLVANGSSLRSLLDTLDPFFALHLVENGPSLILTGPTHSLTAINADTLGATSSSGRQTKVQLERAAAFRKPSRVSVSYSDIGRDYQSGLQRAWQGGTSDRSANQIESALSPPLILSAESAAYLASRAMERVSANGDRAKISLPWRYAGLKPGQSLALPDLSGQWVIDSSHLEAMVVHLNLSRAENPLTISPMADAGRSLSGTDLVHGPTSIHLLDLPWLGEGVANTPTVLAAASGTSPGWKRAALSISSDNGLTWQDAGFTAAPSVLGTTETVLPIASSFLTDRQNHVDIDLLRSDLVLLSTDADGLATGQNLALIGEELIQFETALPLADGRYRLSGLIRGCRGTEWAVGSHIEGERFVLIEPDTLVPLTVAGGASTVSGLAIGLGDEEPVQTGPIGCRAALLPPSPVHIQSQAQSDGSISLRWIRRSRDGWHWADSIDAPLVEQEERYRVSITPQGLPQRYVETSQPSWTYSGPDKAGDVAAGATTALVSVAQLGTFGPSKPATIIIALT